LTRAAARDKVSPSAPWRANREEDGMADRVRKVDYFYVMVPNRAGQGARVLDTLAVHGVNLLAFSGFPSGGKGQLDLVPEKSGELVRAAKKLGLKLSKKKTGFLLDGKDRVGAMSKLLDKLARAKISITAMDAVVAGKGRYGAIFWVKQKDVARTAKLLSAR
jgi:hypothetical protein